MEQNRWEPAVKRSSLVLVAGIVWAIVGLFLFGRGVRSLLPLRTVSFGLIGLGVVFGYLKSRFVFKKIIAKNVIRIKELAPHKEKICVFAFQAWLSYLIVLIMISLGIILRSLQIDPLILGVIYITIGSGLFLASLSYFSHVRDFNRTVTHH